ncbi:MAG: MBL fold metallo-hydrolase [Anaerolineae bacterium]
MQGDEFWIKFRGVRGGYATPGPTTVKYGGNTTCLEVHAGPHFFIIDGGTGLIGLGQEIMAAQHATGQPINLPLLLTHVHNDHIQGLPLFQPALCPHCRLYVFGPEPISGENLEETLQRIMRPPLSPISQQDILSKRTFTHITHGARVILSDAEKPPRHVEASDKKAEIAPENVVIDTHHSYAHPQHGVLVFRVAYQGRSFVFATDVEGYIGGDRRLIRFARHADLLIHDAEYDEHEYADGTVVKQGWGHSTWRMATDVAQAAQVGRLILTHHSPLHDDAYLDEMEKKAQAVFPKTHMAQEGKVVDVNAT